MNSLQRDGYAVLRGFLDVEPVQQAFDRLLKRARAGADPKHYVVEQDPFRLKRVVWAGQDEPVLAALGTHPSFLAVAREVLEADAFVQLIQQAHFKLPGDGVDFAFHQDASNRRYGSELWTDVDGRGSFVQLALAVDAMHSHNGPLRVVPGSHRLGFIADPKTGVLPAHGWSEEAAVDLHLDPGDLAVFGPFLIHGSPPNTGDSPRRLFLQGYAQADANRRVYPGCGTGAPRAVK